MAVATEPVATGLRARGGGLRRGVAPSLLRRWRTAGWGRLPPVPPWSLPRGAGRLLSGPGRGSPLPARPRCPAAAAGSPRPSACLYCSAPLSSLLFIFPPPSHPPCLPTSSLPRSARSPSLSLLLPPSWLPGWLTSSRAPPLAPAAAAPVAPPGLLLPWSRPTMTRRAPRTFPRAPGLAAGTPRCDAPFPEARVRPPGAQPELLFAPY